MRPGRTRFEAPGLVAGLDDMAVMRQAVEQCRGHLGIVEDAGPLREAEIRRDDHAGGVHAHGRRDDLSGIQGKP